VSKSKVAAGHHFGKKGNRHNVAAVSGIFAKFGVLVAVGSLQCPLMSFLGYSKQAANLKKNGKSQLLGRYLRCLRKIWYAGGHGPATTCRDIISDL